MNCPIGNVCFAERPATDGRAGRSEAQSVAPWTASNILLKRDLVGGPYDAKRRAKNCDPA